MQLNNSNINSSNYSTHNSFMEKVMQYNIVLLAFLFAAIVIGNSTVILSVFRIKKKSRMKFFIVNLAMTDLFVAFCAILPTAIWFSKTEFNGPVQICKLAKFSMIMTLYSSSFALVVMSIDRLEAIVCPLRGTISNFRVYIYVAVAWSMASVCALPGMIMVKIKYHKSKGRQCILDFEIYSGKIYITYVFISVLLLPVIAISICHICMITRIFNISSQQRIRRMSLNNCNTISRARVKSVKMSCVIVMVFLVCWAPFFIWNILYTYGHIRQRQSTFFLSYIIQSLAPLNSVANPIIFWTFMAHNTGRRNFLWCKWKREQTHKKGCLFASHGGNNISKCPIQNPNFSHTYADNIGKTIKKDITRTYLIITTL